MKTRDLAQFVENLSKTIEWTYTLSREFDYNNGFYGNVFRSFNPIIDGESMYSFEGDYYSWQIDERNVGNYKKILDQAMSKRESIVNQTFHPGRILCFTIGLTTNAGIAIIDSECFIDENDVPPLDTWFFVGQNDEIHFNDVLFCWIPEGFQTVVQKAMNLDMMKSYYWLDEYMPRLSLEILHKLK